MIFRLLMIMTLLLVSVVVTSGQIPQTFAGPSYTVPAGMTVQVKYPFSVTATETRCTNWPAVPTKLPCHVELHVVAAEAFGDTKSLIVTITNPTNGMTFLPGEQINASANTIDPVGFVLGVEYVANDLLWWSGGFDGGIKAWGNQKWEFTACKNVRQCSKK
jgi:hypothetical protein